MKLKTTTAILLFLAALFALPAHEAKAQFTGKVKRIKIKKRRVGYSYKIEGKINTNPGTTAAYILTKIEPSDKESPKPSMNSFTQMVNVGDEGGNYEATMDMNCEKECLFSKDIDPVGKKYKLTSTLYNKENKAISKTKVQEVIIELDDTDCKVKYSFNQVSLGGMNFHAAYSQENNIGYPMLIKREGSKSNSISIPVAFNTEPVVTITATISITYQDASSQRTQYTAPATFSPKANKLSFAWPDVDTAIIRSITVTSSKCGEVYKEYILNFNKVESVTDAAITFKLKKLNNNNSSQQTFAKDSVLILNPGLALDSKIEGAFQIFTISGVKLSHGEEAVKNAEVIAVLHLKDCKGSTQNIEVALKYNEKTGEYTNAKALSLCNKTGLTFLSMDLEVVYLNKRQEKIRASYKHCLKSDEF